MKLMSIWKEIIAQNDEFDVNEVKFKVIKNSYKIGIERIKHYSEI